MLLYEHDYFQSIPLSQTNKQPSQCVIAKSKRHAILIITCQKIKSNQGYLDAENGDVGARDTWYTVLKP
jgi:hypothetical protein